MFRGIAPNSQKATSQNAFKLVPEWFKMVRNLCPEELNASHLLGRAERGPSPLTQGPPQSTFLGKQLHKQTCRHTQRYTHIHVHRHKRIDKRTHRGRKKKLRSNEQNESSIVELEFQLPSKVFTCLMFLCLGRFRVQQHPGN